MRTRSKWWASLFKASVLRAFVFTSLALLFCPGAAQAGKIEAVKGKRYAVTKEHGPWMVMVASFNEPPPEYRKPGMTPAEAADELVHELRGRGMPAYVFELDSAVEHIETFDRLQEPGRRVYASRRGGVCVLAGNYAAADNDKAVASLEWIKRLRPKFLSGGQADEYGLVTLPNGGIVREAKDRRVKFGDKEKIVSGGPLAGAFMTVNPLLSADEVKHRSVDPLMLRLNAGNDCSLYENKAKYTVVVASFYGKSVTQVPGTKYQDAGKDFAVSDSLGTAGEDACQLARHLRKDRHFDAYVWHDRDRSIVTIGSFDRPDHPHAKHVIWFYGAKVREDPKTHQSTLTAEVITLPERPTPGDPVRKTWICDPLPEVMMVPKLE